MGDAAVNPPAGERVARTPRGGKKEKKVEVDAVGAVLKGVAIQPFDHDSHPINLTFLSREHARLPPTIASGLSIAAVCL